MAEITEEEYETAKLELQAAITVFYEKTDPDTYVAAWLLITHEETIELAQANASCVGMHGPTGQSYVLSRGMLETALDAQRLN